MPTTNPFGNFIVPYQLQDIVLTTLETWFPTYLRRIESELGLARNSIKNPVKYSKKNEVTALKGEALPRVIVICPGIVGEPILHGRTYSAFYRIGIGVSCAAKDEETADFNSKIYGTAARLIILHKRGLGTDGETAPFIKGISWIDEAFTNLPISNPTLLYKAAAEWFAIELDNVVDMTTGPAEPDQQSYDDYGQVPDVDHVIIDVDSEE